MTTYTQTRPDLRILYVDTWSKLNDVRSNPALYGFTVVNIDALDDPALTNKSFNGPGADYLYWGNYHPTSKLQKLIAAWHSEALTNSILEKLKAHIANGSPSIQMDHLQIGRDYMLEKSTDLQTWQPIILFTATAGTNSWAQPESTEPTSYFR
jgi:phospholipase/lecithinase/hemolysin